MPPKSKAKASSTTTIPFNPNLPLQGQTFVFTCQFAEDDPIYGADRTVAEDIVKGFGGKVTGSVSGKTSYLIAGSRMEGGGAFAFGGNVSTPEETSKYRKSMEIIENYCTKEGVEVVKDEQGNISAGGLGNNSSNSCIKILREQGFKDLIEKCKKTAAGGNQTSNNNQVQQQQQNLSLNSSNQNQIHNSNLNQNIQCKSINNPSTKQNNHQPWVIKYAPKTLEDLQGHTASVKKIIEWLTDWDDVVLNGNKKPVQNYMGQPMNINARGLLITGPPGIGKSSAIKIICNHFSSTHQSVWYNASDSRGKKIIDQLSMGGAQVQAVDWIRGGELIGGVGSESSLEQKSVSKRTILVMDEVDGMGAGDRMGTAALSKLIKTTLNPVICIGNDSSREAKMRTLGNVCLDVKFTRPNKGMIAKRVKWICDQEGIFSAEPIALEQLSESCGNDIRQVITCVQSLVNRGLNVSAKGAAQGSGSGGAGMMNSTSNANGSGTTNTPPPALLSYNHIKDTAKQLEKDLTIDGFAAAKKLLLASENKKLSFLDKMDLFFADYDLMPLLIQENYLKYYDSGGQNKNQNIHLIAQAADTICYGDQYSKVLRENNQWSLLQDIGAVGVVYPTSVIHGFKAFPDFPQWLGKNSSANKTKRVVKDLHEAFMSRPLTEEMPISSSFSPAQMINCGYNTLLYKKIMRYLKQGLIEEAAQQITLSGLNKDLLMGQLTTTRTVFGDSFFKDEYALLEKDIKVKLTKELQKPEYMSRANSSSNSTLSKLAKRKSKETKEKREKLDDGQEHDKEEDDDDSDEEDGDEIEQKEREGIEAALKAAKAPKAKGKAGGSKRQKVG